MGCPFRIWEGDIFATMHAVAAALHGAGALDATAIRDMELTAKASRHDRQCAGCPLIHL
jgi:hypothetical protein